MHVNFASSWPSHSAAQAHEDTSSRTASTNSTFFSTFLQGSYNHVHVSFYSCLAFQEIEKSVNPDVCDCDFALKSEVSSDHHRCHVGFKNIEDDGLFVNLQIDLSIPAARSATAHKCAQSLLVNANGPPQKSLFFSSSVTL